MTLGPHAVLEAARKLSAPSAKQLKRARLSLALSRDYWTGLNPELHISNALSQPSEEPELRPDRQKALLQSLGERGYFQGDAILSLESVARIRRCVEALRKERWPAVFAFVYDEPWAIVRGPSMARLLSSALGPRYTQAPGIWAHFIQPGDCGWRPHVDGYDGPDRLAIWLPLSEATLDNGCIFIIPKNRVPPRIARGFHEVARFNHSEVDRLLHHARPLPASPGAVLCWESGVIHWGSQSQPDASPRISMAVEFLREGFRPPRPALSPLDGRKLPSFRERLRVIGKALLDYDRFEPEQLLFREMAQSLLK